MTKKNDYQEDRPPLMKSWPHLYWTVLLNLAGWLTLFYIFRKAFE